MHCWQSGFLEVNGLRLHYTRTGGDKPPLVLAHGGSDDGLCWTPVAEELARNNDVIMPDARGHGQSEASATAYGVDDLAGDLHGVIAGLGLDHPALLGHSMGGRTTFALAGLFPDVPGAILIEDANPLGIAAVDPAAAAEQQAQMRAEFTRLRRQTRAELIARARVEHPDWSEAELGPWADSKRRLNPDGFNLLNTWIDWPVVLRRITCPALLMTADPARGGMVTAERAAELQALIPELRVVNIPGAGHNIRREQLARYLEIVRSFLAT